MRRVAQIKSDYRFKKKLGEGAFGSVVAAKHRQSKLPVAIKIISKAKIFENQTYCELLENELTLLRLVDHPNITRVFELLQDDANYYVVMELIAGGTLL